AEGPDFLGHGGEILTGDLEVVERHLPVLESHLGRAPKVHHDLDEAAPGQLIVVGSKCFGDAWREHSQQIVQVVGYCILRPAMFRVIVCMGSSTQSVYAFLFVRSRPGIDRWIKDVGLAPRSWSDSRGSPPPRGTQ